MILLLLATTLAALAATVAWYGLHMSVRIRLRHIPGPPLAFLSGNLYLDGKPGMWHVGLEEWPRQYGPVLRFLVGHKPYVLITDPDLVQEVGVKQFSGAFRNRPAFPFYLMLNKEDEERASWMLLWARDRKWATVRAAMDPLFRARHLAAYLPLFGGCAQALAESLQSAAAAPAAGGAAGGGVDVDPHFQSFSLSAVGGSVFGVDFGGGGGGREAPLARAARIVMSQRPERSGALLATLVFPPLRRLMVAMLRRGHITPEYRLLISGWRFLTGAAKALVHNARCMAADRPLPGEPLVAPPPPDAAMPLTARLQQEGEAAGAAAFQGALPKAGSVLARLIAAAPKGPDGRALQPLGDDQIIPQAMNLLFGGGDTTGLSLTYTCWELARCPRAQQRICAEVDAFRAGNEGADSPALEDLGSSFPYTQACLQEGLRLHAPSNPIFIQAREAAADTRVGGYFIPKGTAVVLNHVGMAADARLFPQPQAFRPERWLEGSADGPASRSPYASIPFGLGPHTCIANRFAMAEMTVALFHIFSAATLSLDAALYPPGCRLHKVSSITMHPAQPLRVRLHPRQPPPASGLPRMGGACQNRSLGVVAWS